MSSLLLKSVQVAAFGKSTVQEINMLEFILGFFFDIPRGGGWA
jgi:hypothetical protein